MPLCAAVYCCLGVADPLPSEYSRLSNLLLRVVTLDLRNGYSLIESHIIITITDSCAYCPNLII